MRCEDAQELITALVDNEVSADERVAVEDHLKECGPCSLAYQEESALKKALQRTAAAVTAPGDLRERIRSDYQKALKADASRESRKTWGWLAFPGLRPALAFGLLLIVVLPALYFLWPAKNISLAALETHARLLQGKVTLFEADDPKKLAAELGRSAGGQFAPMGYDLSMLNLKPVGGTVQRLRDRKILVTVYKGEGPTVTCFTFLGTFDDVPSHAERFFDPEKKMAFYTFSQGEIHGVLHREGDVICILASKMPMADLLAVARAKARAA